MKIEVTNTIPYPRVLVFRTLRDEMTELLPYLPNVDQIVVKQREELGEGRVRLVNWWKASSEIPTVARALVTPEMTNWTDFATWDESAWCCEWRQETSFFTDRISCRGRNTYRELGPERTELSIRGDLDIDLMGLKGVPKLMAPAVGSAIEKFVVALITPNFTKLSDGLVRYLRARGRGRSV
jgi:hypothetical protein